MKNASGEFIGSGIPIVASAPGDGADDEEGLGSRHDFRGKRSVHRRVGKIAPAGEEAEKISAFSGGVVADGAAKHRKLEFEGVEDGRESDGSGDVEEDVGVLAGESAEVVGEGDTDHFRTCASTLKTAGKSRTMALQLSPPSAEQYTWPPVVPK